MNSKEISYMNENCLERFRKYCKMYYTARLSADNRISTAKKFIKFINKKEKKIGDVKYNIVEEFFDEELEKGTSPVTINNYYSYLKGFFTFLGQNNDNKVMEYDKVRIERIRNINYEVFTDKEIKELFKIINEDKNEQIKLSNRILFSIMFYTGCTLKEIDSIRIYQKESDMVLDDDNYIILDKKEIYFREPNVRKFYLYDEIIEDIINYHRIVAEKINKEKIPNGANLFLTTYGKTKALKKLHYSSLQGRISSIKKKSSFSHKKLSLKNIRHTVIKKMIKSGKSLEFISESIGIDMSTLKYYRPNNSGIETEVINYFYYKHPYKNIII